jgi:hypothetical protein
VGFALVARRWVEVAPNGGGQRSRWCQDGNQLMIVEAQ